MPVSLGGDGPPTDSMLKPARDVRRKSPAEVKFDAEVERLCQKYLQEEAVWPAEHGAGVLLPVPSDRLRVPLGADSAEALISGRTVPIDATTLEANAALKSIVRSG